MSDFVQILKPRKKKIADQASNILNFSFYNIWLPTDNQRNKNVKNYFLQNRIRQFILLSVHSTQKVNNMKKYSNESAMLFILAERFNSDEEPKLARR